MNPSRPLSTTWTPPGLSALGSAGAVLPRKILRDLWRQKTRSLLVILSVAVGVLGVGSILCMKQTLSHDLSGRYAEINPAHIVLGMTEGVTLDDVQGLLSLPNVAAAQGRAVYGSRVRVGDGPWKTAVRRL